ncbi:MAG: stage II sporulation protein R [Bacilli bacterium]|nr:stage II sporulation protein R [Bacilli bacterium]
MKKILLVFLFIFLTFFDAYSYAHAIQNEISEKVIRLHVVADSDSTLDQELKLKVRDAVLNFMKEKDYENYEIAFSSISSSLNEIKEIAEETLASNNCFDTVKVELGDFYFPKKDYDALSFPAGLYNALRITIGSGKGQNWWCVMFPTLCFSGVSVSTDEASENLKNSLSEDAFSIIANEAEFRFKIVDFFNRH